MSREEMIEIIIKDWFGWNKEGIEEMLRFGWGGFDKYTNLELKETIETIDEVNFDKKTAEKIIIEKKRLQHDRVKKLKHDLDALIEKAYPELRGEERSKNEDFLF